MWYPCPTGTVLLASSMYAGGSWVDALFTPNEDWRDAVDCPKDFINVIEDARIEESP